MKKPYILIMAGGSGTRLWPLSTEKNPKQLLQLYGKNSLLEDTLQRCLLITKKKNIFIGTNNALKKAIRKQRPDLKSENFLIEPVARNTAPIIALFCAKIRQSKKHDSQRPIIVLSADHFIQPAEAWAEAARLALPQAGQRIWCLGIQPTRPDTGYGYIECGSEISSQLFEIISFKEKPNESTAGLYLQKQNFLWNSGMFIFTADRFWSELLIAQKEMAGLAEKCLASKKALRKYFPQMQSISVDYAVLEKSKQLGVVQASFTWDDVGSYLALERIVDGDEADNINPAGAANTSLASHGNTIFSDKLKHINLLGVQNLVIAEKNGVLLIANKDKIGDIKELRALAPEKLH